MKNGFVKVAAASPAIRVADPVHNAKEAIRLAHAAAKAGAHLLVFPELCLTGATCSDLFFSHALLSGARDALALYLKECADLQLVSVIGLPVSHGNRLYDCAAVTLGKKLLGIVPRSHVTSGNDVAGARHFSPAPSRNDVVSFLGEEIPFGSHLIFSCRELPLWKLGVTVGEDSKAIISTALLHATAGATVLCHSLAEPEGVLEAERRVQRAQACSVQTVASYVFSSAGTGESTTDAVFGGHRAILENGVILAEEKPFSKTELCYSEIDLERLVTDRRRRELCPVDMPKEYREVFFSMPLSETTLTREVPPCPFVPTDTAEKAARCRRILSIQIEGLKQRIERAHAKRAVIGISGGLDSTLALLVAVGAMDALGRPRKDILAVTMPCFGTTERTKNNATVLCEELGTDFCCVDIFDAVNQHFSDIGHDPNRRDVTYENAQARERTQILMDLANEHSGMVIGTGDLSELALGWATYNGDHMSMYGVNASVPKTLIRHVVSFCADEYEADGKDAVAAALRDVLDTPVSPELLPADEDGSISQKTEDLVGPYEIHDFYLYYLVRFGFSPAKLYRLAKYALGGVYSDEVLLRWLKVLLRRFFTQQFKRSCLPDGPAVGSVTLSPRGGWSMPSDASFALWSEQAEALK